MGVNTMKSNYFSAANVCLVISVVALIMAEYGLTSLFGSWQPTHQTAIAFGVISIAISNIGKNI